MDERVKEMLNKAKYTAGSAVSAGRQVAGAAGKKAGELVGAGKLRLKVFDLNAEIDALYKQIGKQVYLHHTGAQIDEQELQSALDAIDEKFAAIASAKGELDARKATVTCPACGRECDRDDAFCRVCGQSLR